MSLKDFEALLLLSFGGPEGNDEVIPFLENVTRGRGIPKERLEKVGEHYFHFDGVSPINGQNLEIVEQLRVVLRSRGHELPVYFGNRNWHPFAEDTAREMLEAGHRNILVFATSAWGGYSACRQYDEDIAKLHQAYPELNFTKLWQFYGHPTFVQLTADFLRKAVASIDREELSTTRILFSAHSIPTAADDAAGGNDDANLYSRQVLESSQLVAEHAGVQVYENVWQSRSGDPRTPWLEPDIVDRVKELHQEGVTHIICVPIGFLTDHMEVVWDLDTELKATCDALGVGLTRVPTIGLEPEFAAMIVDIVECIGDEKKPPTLSTLTVQGCTENGTPCRIDCCDPVRPRPLKQS